MKRTRIIIALAVAIVVTGPLLGLDWLSQDLRRSDFFADIYKHTTVAFPILSSIMLPFGPIDWWAYITPAALGVAAGASFRKPVPTIVLAGILGAVVLHSLAMIAAAKPYFMIPALTGSLSGPPYPTAPLIANLCLVGTSVGLAVYSVSRMVVHGRAVRELTKAAEKKTTS